MAYVARLLFLQFEIRKIDKDLAQKARPKNKVRLITSILSLFFLDGVPSVRSRALVRMLCADDDASRQLGAVL